MLVNFLRFHEILLWPMTLSSIQFSSMTDLNCIHMQFGSKRLDNQFCTSNGLEESTWKFKKQKIDFDNKSILDVDTNWWRTTTPVAMEATMVKAFLSNEMPIFTACTNFNVIQMQAVALHTQNSR